MWKVFRLSPILVIILLLLILCLHPKLAHAQTLHAHPKPPKIVTVLIKNSTWNRGYYYFSPSSVSCKIRKVCLVFVNQTGTWIELVDNYGDDFYLAPGGTESETYDYTGTYYYTTATQNVNVPLAVHLHT